MTDEAKAAQAAYKKRRRAHVNIETPAPANRSGLSDDARAARNEYKRLWRARNKDKVRASNERYWEKKAKEGAQK